MGTTSFNRTNSGLYCKKRGWGQTRREKRMRTESKGGEEEEEGIGRNYVPLKKSHYF